MYNPRSIILKASNNEYLDIHADTPHFVTTEKNLRCMYLMIWEKLAIETQIQKKKWIARDSSIVSSNISTVDFAIFYVSSDKIGVCLIE